jgi:AcrR family transcriptional regulator
VDVNVATRLTRAEAQAQTRQKLLESATRVFAKKGFAAATIEEIAERAGYTRGAFYAHFADKGDVFMTILEGHTDMAMGAVRDAVTAAPEAEKLAAVLGWFDRLVIDRELELAFGEFQAVAARDRRLRGRLARRYRGILDIATEMIEEYDPAAGVPLAAPPAEVATIVVALVDGLTTARRLVPDAVPPRRLAEALLYLWAGLTAR